MELLSFEARRICTSPFKQTHVSQGPFTYYHYKCDGFDDTGWGCGYRTLQSLCSWICKNVEAYKQREVPSIQTIQTTLVKLEDKPYSFINSREWIGSVEVCLVIDSLFDIPCKILHINTKSDVIKYVDTLAHHFENNHCPIMMGGDADCSSKGIIGISRDGDNTSFLIMDPHFVGRAKSVEALQHNGWIRWSSIDDLVDNSFYNICIPQIK